MKQLSLFDDAAPSLFLSTPEQVVEFCCSLMRLSSDEVGFLSRPTVRRYVDDRACLVQYAPDGRPVAYLLHSPLRPGIVVHIHQVCVTRTERGRGYGTALVERLRRMAIECECRAIRLVCGANMTRQLAFWPRFGFVPVAEQQRENRRKRAVRFFWLDLCPALFQADLSLWSEPTNTPDIALGDFE